jgi:hypothetical protein
MLQIERTKLNNFEFTTLCCQTLRDASEIAITIGTGEILIAPMFTKAINGDAQMAIVTPK